MHDSGKVLTGIVIFLVVTLFPVWFSLAGGGLGEAPAVDPGQGSCVRDRDYMKSSHMELLDEWRNAVVRDGDREPVVVGGRPYEKSLTNSCLSCHAYRDFCLECHDFMGVEPKCYECHIIPEEN